MEQSENKTKTKKPNKDETKSSGGAKVSAKFIVPELTKKFRPQRHDFFLLGLKRTYEIRINEEASDANFFVIFLFTVYASIARAY